MILLRRKTQHNQLPPSSNDLPESREQKEPAVFKQLKQCVKTNDHRHFRETLISWANLYWQQPLHTLNDIAGIAATPSLKAQLEALDQALYHSGNTDDINLNTLCDEIQALRKQSKEKTASNGNHLKQLYNN